MMGPVRRAVNADDLLSLAERGWGGEWGRGVGGGRRGEAAVR